MISQVLTETLNGHPRDDDDLIAGLKSARSSGADEKADELFSLLVHRHQRNVFKLVLSVLGPGRSSEAEDVTQEVFLKVYHQLEGFRSESRFSTWLYRISYRRAVDKKRLARFRLPHVDDEVLSSMPGEGSAAGTDPFTQTLNAEARLKLYAAVMALDEPQRAAVLLHYWMDEDVATIAQLLDRRPGTVKSLLFRARRKLSKRLGKEGLELLP